MTWHHSAYENPSVPLRKKEAQPGPGRAPPRPPQLCTPRLPCAPRPREPSPAGNGLRPSAEASLAALSGLSRFRPQRFAVPGEPRTLRPLPRVPQLSPVRPGHSGCREQEKGLRATERPSRSKPGATHSRARSHLGSQDPCTVQTVASASRADARRALATVRPCPRPRSHSWDTGETRLAAKLSAMRFGGSSPSLTNTNVPLRTRDEMRKSKETEEKQRGCEPIGS